MKQHISKFLAIFTGLLLIISPTTLLRGAHNVTSNCDEILDSNFCDKHIKKIWDKNHHFWESIIDPYDLSTDDWYKEYFHPTSISIWLTQSDTSSPDCGFFSWFFHPNNPPDFMPPLLANDTESSKALLTDFLSTVKITGFNNEKTQILLHSRKSATLFQFITFDFVLIKEFQDQPIGTTGVLHTNGTYPYRKVNGQWQILGINAHGIFEFSS